MDFLEFSFKFLISNGFIGQGEERTVQGKGGPTRAPIAHGARTFPPRAPVPAQGPGLGGFFRPHGPGRYWPDTPRKGKFPRPPHTPGLASGRRKGGGKKAFPTPGSGRGGTTEEGRGRQGSRDGAFRPGIKRRGGRWARGNPEGDAGENPGRTAGPSRVTGERKGRELDSQRKRGGERGRRQGSF